MNVCIGQISGLVAKIGWNPIQGISRWNENRFLKSIRCILYAWYQQVLANKTASRPVNIWNLIQKPRFFCQVRLAQAATYSPKPGSLLSQQSLDADRSQSKCSHQLPSGSFGCASTWQFIWGGNDYRTSIILSKIIYLTSVIEARQTVQSVHDSKLGTVRCGPLIDVRGFPVEPVLEKSNGFPSSNQSLQHCLHT